MFYAKMLSISALPQPSLPKNNQTVLIKAKEKAKALGLYLDGLYLGHHDMSAFLFPYADEDRLIDASLMASLLYYIDDLFGEDSETRYTFDLNSFKAAWEGGEISYSKEPIEMQLYEAVASLGADFRAKASAEFLAFYQGYLYLHLDHSLRPSLYTNSQEYLDSRVHFGGMYPTILLIEYCANQYLSPEMHANLDLLAAQEALALIGAISNDLISYPKEKHSQFNLINAYLATGEAQSLEQAIQKTIIYINQLHETYQKAIAAFLATANTSPIARQYVDYLDNMLAACYHWQLHSKRYRHPEHILEDLKLVEVSSCSF